MDQSQVPDEKPDEKPKGGCGCGGGSANVRAVYRERPQMSDQQQKLISRIKKTAQRKNSNYNTNTRYFI